MSETSDEFLNLYGYKWKEETVYLPFFYLILIAPTKPPSLLEIILIKTWIKMFDELIFKQIILNVRQIKMWKKYM